MRPIIAIPLAAMILLAGWYVSEDPTRIGPFFDYLDDFTQEIENTAPSVQMQTEERWLVVVVDFPNAPETGFRNVEKAQTLLTGINGADDYISEATGGATTLSVTIVPTVYHAQNSDSYWGQDEGDVRDVGQDGSDGPGGLASSVIINSLSGVDLSQFDLDSDGWIDRFLIIHTAEVQEDSGGSGSIWSHYGPLAAMVEVDGYKFDHYTIAGFDSGFGTIVHEMLHQIGALDLYDVHGQGTGEDWNGLGDWDVMASGNWNGVNGRTPALPSLATLDLIGVNRATEISLNNPGETQNYVLSPMSSSGSGLYIQISPSERVWMAYRGSNGFDSELPGHGLLVTVQDTSVGDSAQNLINTNPDIPWLYVLEADGDNGLLAGNDQGSSGDTFTTGGKFGAEGRILIDHYGRQVNWVVEVTEFDSGSLSLTISTSGAPSFEVLPPHHPIQLLKNEDLIISVNSSTACTLGINLNSSDGRTLSIVENTPISVGESVVRTLRWDSPGIVGGEARLTGQFTCGSSPDQQVSIDFHTIGLRLVNSEYNSDISSDDDGFVNVPLEFSGLGQQVWEVRLEGPIDRIASTAPTQNLGDGSKVNLTISPNGLLVPGMVARGEIVLRDSQGLEQRIEVILTAEQFEQGGELVRFFSDPANLIITMAGLIALSILLGMRKRKSPQSKIREAGRQEAMNHLKTVGHDGPSPLQQSQFSAQPQTMTQQETHQQNVQAESYLSELLEVEKGQPRPESISDGVAKFTGPERPSSQPSKKPKVGITHDPNEIPDLDDLL